MPFQVCFYHIIWTTRNREPLITPDIESLILATIQRKSKELKSPIFALNTVEDHLHVAVQIALSIAVSDWVKQVKDAVGELIFHNRYSYANGNPVNLTDPSGHCVGCEADFRVRLADADLPDLRDEVLSTSKKEVQGVKWG